jgi:redox-sensitive bicupin YhaK (pirin superfamily)
LLIGGDEVTAGQMALLEPGADVRLDSPSGARALLLGGAAADGPRHIWWNFVSSSQERIEQAKRDWREGRFAAVPGETEFIPLPED